MHRFIVGLIAMFSAALLAVTAAPADARDTTSITSSKDAAASAAENAERGRIRLTIHGEIVNNTRLKINGQARGWRSKPVLLQRKRGLNGAWRVVERDRTTREGRYLFASAPVPRSGRYYFRTKVKSPRYAPSATIGWYSRSAS
ncbi:hypothetical protein [Nocardioides antri]|uniref:Uncharacterized protein n=1 Tax=Nocardioides antri TaxID=2607659 RepID=A0A5B1M6U8_9ACTN|nr:hypothetical protein [Nocardioides antri]KAA1428374.1 hypothetical protein F0U47_05465 [Nocardioides antri]